MEAASCGRLSKMTSYSGGSDNYGWAPVVDIGGWPSCRGIIGRQQALWWSVVLLVQRRSRTCRDIVAAVSRHRGGITPVVGRDFAYRQGRVTAVGKSCRTLLNFCRRVVVCS